MTAPEFCRIEERFIFDGIALHIGRAGNGYRSLQSGDGTWIHVDPDGLRALGEPDGYTPALVVTDSMAREILRALVVYYGGADDLRALRKDYDAERARVDLLIRSLLPAAAVAP